MNIREWEELVRLVQDKQDFLHNVGAYEKVDFYVMLEESLQRMYHDHLDKEKDNDYGPICN